MAKYQLLRISNVRPIIFGEKLIYSHEASQDTIPGVNAKPFFKKRFMTLMSLRLFRETIKMNITSFDNYKNAVGAGCKNSEF